MRFERLAQTSDRVRRRGARLAKIDALQSLLAELPGDLIRPAVALLSGVLPNGKIGIGTAALRAARPESWAEEPRWTVGEVLDTFDRIAATKGQGSKQKKLDLLSELLSGATDQEGDFLLRLLVGELRQGALEGVMIDALARHTEIELERVRRAAMVAGDLPAVAEALLTLGADGLADFRVEVFRPLQPMLAQPAESAAEALEGIDRAAIDLKLDGVRVQIHRSEDRVRVYSRRLNDVTRSVPEVVEATLRWPARSFIADGETYLPGPQGIPLPFQATMSRFGRRTNVEKARRKSPLEVRLFDLLFLDDVDLTEKPLAERWRALEGLVGESEMVPHTTVDSVEAAEEFFEAALDQGHEGAMVKDLDSDYKAGTRSSGWKKLKTAHTLDLVVLAAEWGSGRRQGKLSNLHLGARSQDGQFVMLGKTFKGLTDRLLEWQTRELLARRLDPEQPDQPTDGNWVVPVRPELVVEVAFNNVQASSQYPGGMALRFARVKRYRPDKGAEQANTIEDVRSLFEREHGASV